jgi:hypothetical protein
LKKGATLGLLFENSATRRPATEVNARDAAVPLPDLAVPEAGCTNV